MGMLTFFSTTEQNRRTLMGQLHGLGFSHCQADFKTAWVGFEDRERRG